MLMGLLWVFRSVKMIKKICDGAVDIMTLEIRYERSSHSTHGDLICSCKYGVSNRGALKTGRETMINESTQARDNASTKQVWVTPELQELSVGKLTESAMGPFSDGATMGQTQSPTLIS